MVGSLPSLSFSMSVWRLSSHARIYRTVISLFFFPVPVRVIESSAFEQVKHFSQFTFVGIYAPALEDPWEGKLVIFPMLVHHLTHL